MYLSLKALHLISMVAWFAGLFYIFRLFVYHVQNQKNESIHGLFLTMEGKLLRIIMRPAAVITLLLGVSLLLLNSALLQSGWLWLKLFLVTLLLGYHGTAEWTHLCHRKNHFPWTERQCRMINEFPTLILISVIFLAILKPF